MNTNRFSAVAHAKINLALHVVGRKDNGFHLLDSLVCFCEYGDQIELKPGALSRANAPLVDLSIKGPFAHDLGSSSDNLICRAASLLAKNLEPVGVKCTSVQVKLGKNLPVASGIGGGSANAAAVLNLLVSHWLDENQLHKLPIDLEKLSLPLGADIPMCLNSEPKKIGGVGEKIFPLATLPALNLVLVNSGDRVPTPQIFNNLVQKNNSALEEVSASRLGNANNMIDYLSAQRNDLQPIATKFAPIIEAVITEIQAQNGCLLARMSGSGATCFGIFENKEEASRAVISIKNQNPNWWVVSTKSIPGRDALQSLDETKSS